MPPLEEFLQPMIDAFTSLLNSAVAAWVEVAIPLLIQMITDTFAAFLGGFAPV